MVSEILLKSFSLTARRGRDTYYLPPERLTAEDQKFPIVSQVFSAYNGVKYLVVNNAHIYKYTPSGELTRLFTSYYQGVINDLIANKDSRTVYITAGGRIYGIFNNEVHYLVGAHTQDGWP